MIRDSYNIFTGMNFWFEPDEYTKRQDMIKRRAKRKR